MHGNQQGQQIIFSQQPSSQIHQLLDKCLFNPVTQELQLVADVEQVQHGLVQYQHVLGVPLNSNQLFQHEHELAFKVQVAAHVQQQVTDVQQVAQGKVHQSHKQLDVLIKYPDIQLHNGGVYFAVSMQVSHVVTLDEHVAHGFVQDIHHNIKYIQMLNYTPCNYLGNYHNSMLLNMHKLEELNQQYQHKKSNQYYLMNNFNKALNKLNKHQHSNSNHHNIMYKQFLMYMYHSCWNNQSTYMWSYPYPYQIDNYKMEQINLLGLCNLYSQLLSLNNSDKALNKLNKHLILDNNHQCTKNKLQRRKSHMDWYNI
ncbi:unnamed protein product [Paramecium primaurelia]|uniref:Uncharacterized protein n=1 Tax=Paramecium primaurelia TaxID=5886 RepID=A0A8S1NM17_PARPR|nr:unnamed protein product [Paramecium primaurelia]